MVYVLIYAGMVSVGLRYLDEHRGCQRVEHVTKLVTLYRVEVFWVHCTCYSE